MATQQRSEQDLRREAAEAMAELDRVTRRMGEIDDEIEAERQSISRQRVAAAKRGDSPLMAVDRVGLEGLTAEREELPELHFVARLRAVGAKVALEEAVAARLEPQIAEAEENLRPLAEAAAEAAARAEAADVHLRQLRNQRGGALDRSKRHVELIRRIEDEGPRPLV